MTVYFDDSLPYFAGLVKEKCGGDALRDSFFLRDVAGLLTLIVGSESRAKEIRDAIYEAARKIEPYIETGAFFVATPDELFDDRLKDEKNVRTIYLVHPEFSGNVRLLDRRMVGGDWLRSLSAIADRPARLAFTSIKGGVGRSTALCVLAAHLAANGKRVLTVDMDLEAPGLGNMLLSDETLPEFGLLDYLVERSLGNVTDEFYADMVSTSWIGGGVGRVDVVPALGKRSLLSPQNVLAKIARAYLSESSDTDELGFTDHVNQLLTELIGPAQYDAILLDARAGLHETTAAAVLGVGAHVFLFGIDQPQTYTGYELLLSHLGTLSSSNEADWASRLTFVQAKSDLHGGEVFSSKIKKIFTKYLVPSNLSSTVHLAADLSALGETFDVDWTNNEVDGRAADSVLVDDGISVVSILESEYFRNFDPASNADLLHSDLYGVGYREFLEIAVSSLNIALEKS